MRRAAVLYKDEKAGLLEQLSDGSFEFRYLDEWVENPSKPSICLNFPKRKESYRSNFLFPFFFNMLPEGANKKSVCFNNRIDEDDYFGILLTTAGFDTIGAVRVLKMDDV